MLQSRIKFKLHCSTSHVKWVILTHTLPFRAFYRGDIVIAYSTGCVLQPTYIELSSSGVRVYAVYACQVYFVIRVSTRIVWVFLVYGDQ